MRISDWSSDVCSSDLRAANLVRQLLAFSRQQTLIPRVLDVTEMLADLSHLLRRLIGETVTLELVHGRDLKPVKADPGQLEQVLINLVVNARDAMPSGGVIRMRTSQVPTVKVLCQGEEASRTRTEESRGGAEGVGTGRTG